MQKPIHVGLLGCGTIGGFVLNAILQGRTKDAVVSVICTKTTTSKGAELARKHKIPLVRDVQEMIQKQPDVILESASHESVETYAERILLSGIGFIPMSLGALVDDRLLKRLQSAAEKGNSLFIIPSGGIGGLDAISAAALMGLDEVTMTTRKPPEAWKHISAVENTGIDLDALKEPYLLFEGSARECVKEYPQNINIAAALSLAGVGFDKTKIRIFADPTISTNTHLIECRGAAGRKSFLFENTPAKENPKTTYQACASAAEALSLFTSKYIIL